MPRFSFFFHLFAAFKLDGNVCTLYIPQYLFEKCKKKSLLIKITLKEVGRRGEKYVLFHRKEMKRKNYSSSSLMSFTYKLKLDGSFSSSSIGFIIFFSLKKPFNMYQQTTLRTESWTKLIFIKLKLVFSYG